MATRLVRYALENGLGSIVVEEQVDDRGGYVGRGDVVEEAAQSLKWKPARQIAK